MLREKVGESAGVAGRWVLECWSCWSAGVRISTVGRSAKN